MFATSLLIVHILNIRHSYSCCRGGGIGLADVSKIMIFAELFTVQRLIIEQKRDLNNLVHSWILVLNYINP